VALSVTVALIVLPAILRLSGPHVERWRIPGLAVSAAESETGMGYRLARFVQRRAVICLVLSAGLLVALALPVMDMQLGNSDAGNNPTSYPSRRAYDLLAAGFGPGFNGPVIVAFRIDGGDPAAMERRRHGHP
jgi:RND superfamily putative drug exporter